MEEMGMSLAKKLNLKDGMQLRVVGMPEGIDLGDVPSGPASATEGVLAFTWTLADVDAVA
jgi:hypothetical protein